jgi:hypothetical protein
MVTAAAMGMCVHICPNALTLQRASVNLKALECTKLPQLPRIVSLVSSSSICITDILRGYIFVTTILSVCRRDAV